MKKTTTTRKILGRITISFAILTAIGLSLTYVYFRQTSLQKYNLSLLTGIYGATILASDKTVIDLQSDITADEKIPKNVQNAFVAIEDKRFFSHKGIDYKRLAGALVNNIKSKSAKEGGSTISQQLIKNTHLSSEKKLSRKVNEYFLAQKVEKDFSKDNILRIYLNEIYYGSGIYGLKNASAAYFNKDYSELNLSESATLAAIVNSPKRYSPVHNYKNSVERRNLVLKEMHKQNMISTEEFEKAIHEKISVNPNFSSVVSDASPFESYTEAVYAEAAEILGKTADFSNLIIETHLDRKKQISLKNAADGLRHDFQGVILNNKSGFVEAYFSNNKLAPNHKRQPASTVKPILVYAPALESGKITAATQILDKKTDFGGYIPKNHDNKYRGLVSVRHALSHSLNVPAVKIFKICGIENCKDFAKKAGLSFSEKDKGYALALGGFTEGITLLENANTYQAIFNGGKFIKKSFIKSIRTKDNVLLYEMQKTIHPAKNNIVMREDTAAIITDILKDGVKNGTSYKLKNLPFEVAGKTGTAGTIKGNTDAYSIAGTTEHTVAIWRGNLAGGIISKNIGGSQVAELTKTVLKSIYANEYPKNFTLPKNVVRMSIDADELKKGNLISSSYYSKNTLSEIFSINNAPKAIKYKEFEFEKQIKPIEKQTSSKKDLMKIIKKLITPKEWLK